MVNRYVYSDIDVVNFFNNYLLLRVSCKKKFGFYLIVYVLKKII